jgi:putative ABC transport system permease protein
MTFLKLSLKNLLRYRIRTLLTLIGILASVAVLFSILSFNRGFERGLSQELERTGIHFMVVPSGCPHEVASLVLHGAVIPKFLDASIIEKIKEVRGIALVSPVLVTQVPNPARDRVDLVYGIEMSDVQKLKPSWKINGIMPKHGDEVLVGAAIAQHDNLKEGDVIHYPTFKKTFRVTGIIEKTGGQDDAYIYMPVSTVQRMLKKPENLTAIGVQVSEPDSLYKIAEELSLKVPGIQIVTMNQVMKSLADLANSARIMNLSIAVIAIIISAVGVMNTVLMAIFERTQEIGMMRAIGASRLDIVRIILSETILMTTAGGVLGVILATIASGTVEGLVKKSVPYVPSGEMITFEPWLAGSCILFSFVIGIVAGFYPAYRASNITPVEAIRG